MQQLSLTDSIFLYAEDERMPMHIGSIYIIVPDKEEVEFDFESLRQFMLDRIHLSPVYRRRLLETPLNMGRPYWINDPDFNIDNHLFHVSLPKGGTRADLLKLAAQIYSRPLDRSKPLWSQTVISGLENVETVPKNAYAMVTKIHHANIDGMGGTEIMKAMLDLSPTPRKVPPPKAAWKPEKISSMPALIAKDYAKRIFEYPKSVGKFLSSTTSSLRTMSQGLTPKELMEQLKPGKFAPQSILNQSVTPTKDFGFIDMPISRVKKIKNLGKVKVNDVMLAICSGGLRKYLLEKEALPNRSLIAGVPVSMRSTADMNADGGNQVNMMSVELETTEKDPIQRLLKIHNKTKQSKVIAKAAPVDSITKLIPSEVAAAASKLYTRMGFLSKYALMHNVYITNVPGPPMPLYINGGRILHNYGFGITTENMGLMIVILSTEDRFTITLTVCKDIIPDPQHLADCIQSSLNELEHALENKELEHDFFKELADKYEVSEEQKSIL